MADFFSSYDVLLTPATAVTAFPVGEPPGEIGGREVQKGWKGFMPFAIPWNLTGRPAASVPCGFDSDGLPIGLMVVGGIGDEATVLRVAAELERSHPTGTPLDRIQVPKKLD
jgi:aspartyl-tRNA(Asn)/glutamyl-tRNA(Gln) amidotransferase subunit A